MALAALRRGVLDALDGVVDLLLGEPRVHRDVELAVVEELVRARALVRIVAHALEAREVVGRLVVEDALHAFLLVEDLHELVTRAPELLLVHADRVEMVAVEAVRILVDRLDARDVLDALGDLVRDLAALGDEHVELVELDAAVLCTTSTPTLSSIPTFDASLGYAAGRALNEILLKRARGRVIRTRHTQVVTRHSTDDEAISDIFVSKALGWARNHLNEKLTADRLAAYVRCSKPYLQERTELALGVTLAAAIRRLRLTTATELLTTTDLPVSEISQRCGFACISHFAVLMKDVYGLTPLAYRKRNGSLPD